MISWRVTSCLSNGAALSRDLSPFGSRSKILLERSYGMRANCLGCGEAGPLSRNAAKTPGERKAVR